MTSNPLKAATLAFATAVLGLSSVATAAPADRPQAAKTGKLEVIGLTADSQLIAFSVAKPSKYRDIGFVSGLGGADTALIGIDFRVQDGLLYGVGNGGGVYQIDSSNGLATLVNSLSLPLSGSAFGVDFNPAADRLRIISDTGLNLRHNVNEGGVTLGDLALNYTTGVTALGIAAGAYTNNDLDTTTATALYDIDTQLDQVAIQSPPNNGSLAASGLLGVAATAQVGMDIFSTLENGITVANDAFASVAFDDGTSSFYSLNLLTGQATLEGSFGSRVQVVDIALPVTQ